MALDTDTMILELDGVPLRLVEGQEDRPFNEMQWHLPGRNSLSTAALRYSAVSQGQRLIVVLNEGD